jgi:hypothetical protein
MALIVAIHFPDRFDRVIWSLKCHKALSRRHVFIEARTLRDHESAGCEVANRSVTEPSLTGAYVEILCDGELAA